MQTSQTTSKSPRLLSQLLIQALHGFWLRSIGLATTLTITFLWQRSFPSNLAKPRRRLFLSESLPSRRDLCRDLVAYAEHWACSPTLRPPPALQTRRLGLTLDSQQPRNAVALSSKCGVAQTRTAPEQVPTTVNKPRKLMIPVHSQLRSRHVNQGGSAVRPPRPRAVQSTLAACQSASSWLRQTARRNPRILLWPKWSPEARVAALCGDWTVQGATATIPASTAVRPQASSLLHLLLWASTGRRRMGSRWIRLTSRSGRLWEVERASCQALPARRVM